MQQDLLKLMSAYPQATVVFDFSPKEDRWHYEELKIQGVTLEVEYIEHVPVNYVIRVDLTESYSF